MSRIKELIEEIYGGPPTVEELAHLMFLLYQRYFEEKGYDDPEGEVYKMIDKLEQQEER